MTVCTLGHPPPAPVSLFRDALAPHHYTAAGTAKTWGSDRERGVGGPSLTRGLSREKKGLRPRVLPVYPRRFRRVGKGPCLVRLFVGVKNALDNVDLLI